MNYRKLTALLKRFCADRFGEIRVKHSKSFAYFYSSDTITYTTDFGAQADKILDFKEYLFQTFGLDLTDDKLFFIFSFLHEVGHYMTMDGMSDEELVLEVCLRKLIESKEDNDKIADQAYYNLPSEKLANEWANEYFTEHFDELMKYFEDLEI